MVTLGAGTTSAVTAEVAKLGTNILIVSPGQAGPGVQIFTAATALVQDTDPVGETVRLRDVPCKVIGVLAKKGAAAFGPDPDDVILAPLKMVQRRLTGNSGIGTVFVAVADGYATAEVQAGIQNLL